MQRPSVTGSSSSWVCAGYAQPFATSGFIQEKVFSPGTPYLVVKERANTDVIQWIWKQPFWKEMLAIPPPAKAGGTLARKQHGRRRNGGGCTGRNGFTSPVCNKSGDEWLRVVLRSC